MSAKKTLLLHASALVVVAVWCWYVYQPSDESSTDQVLVDISVNQVDRLTYRSDQREVTVTSIGDVDEVGFEVSVKEKVAEKKNKKLQGKDSPNQTSQGKDAPKSKSDEGKKAQNGKDKQGSPANETKPKDAPLAKEKISTYRANREYTKSLERMLPLVAIRQLGVVGEEKAAQFELNDSKVFSITSREQTIVYRIGKKSYGGTSVYIQERDGEKVFLVSSSLLRSIDFRAPRYMERRWIGVEAKDVSLVKIDCSEVGSRTLRKKKQDKTKVEWVPEEDPKADAKIFSNWMDKLLRLSISEYLQTDPTDRNDLKKCKISFIEEGQEVDLAHLVWSPDGSQHYAKTGFSRSWVALQALSVRSVVSDLASILGSDASK